jgi:hypothetical protein
MTLCVILLVAQHGTGNESNYEIASRDFGR